jgi:hypothetical protein
MDYCENSDMLRAIEYVEESEESLLVKQLTEAEKAYKYDRKKLPVKRYVFCDIGHNSPQMIK